MQNNLANNIVGPEFWHTTIFRSLTNDVDLSQNIQLIYLLSIYRPTYISDGYNIIFHWDTMEFADNARLFSVLWVTIGI